MCQITPQYWNSCNVGDWVVDSCKRDDILDWSLYTCLSQLYDGRDVYGIYYIKTTTCFGTLHWQPSG
jgi:hypothetical protein